MEFIADPSAFQKTCLAWQRQGLKTALVPTMGYLHQGHLSLLKYSREIADKVILSIFVNPTQFGPTEDLEKYPRNLERDLETARTAGVDLVFAPAAEAMYPRGSQTVVDVPDMSKRLCGRSRPAHFRGVTTVVCKLFLLSLPTVAVFGEKDRQQLIILQRMAKDLNFPIQVVGRPTVREADGLAMSSRNVYLTADERRQAPELYATLRAAQELINKGERRVMELDSRLRSRLEKSAPLSRIDYLEFVDPDTLEPVTEISGPTILATAIFLGQARLIDNVVLTP